MAVDIDGVLEAIGEFGPYQRRIYFLLCMPVIFVGAANLSYVFISAEPKYRCYVSGCDKDWNNNPVYDEPFLNFTIPRVNDTNAYDSCNEFVRSDLNSTVCTKNDFSHTIEPCQHGLIFDTSIYESTTISEFNLTCSRRWEASADQAVYFAGMLVGALLFGVLSDMIGRRKTILIGIVIMSVSGITIALVPNKFSFHVMRFINAMASSGVFQTVFVLALEFVGPDKRVMFGIVGEYFFALGEVLLGLVALAVNRWRMLQLIISVPVAIFLFYYWVVPESVRWMQAKGRHARVVAALETMARANKKTIPLQLLRHHTFNNEGTEEPDDVFDILFTNQQKVTVLDIFTSLVMALRTVFMILIWVTTTLVYYGLSFNASSLGTDAGSSTPYIDFIFSAFAEIPGYSIAWIGMVYGGRRISLLLSLFISAVACGGTGFLKGKYLLIVFLIGKCFITSAFAIIYVFTAEIFPTNVRNTIVGVCSMFARIGGMLAPFSTSLRSIYPPLPLLVFGGLSLFSSLLTLIMPETLNTKLPDTLTEAINLGKRSPVVVEVTDGDATNDEREGLLENQSNKSESDTEPVS